MISSTITYDNRFINSYMIAILIVNFH